MKTHINSVLFGGTFDPIHCGHIGMVKSLFKQVSVDKIIVVPNKQPPHKPNPIATHKQRLALLKIALQYFPLADHINYQVSELELNREGPSYMYDTVCTYQASNPAYSLGLLIGGDNLLSFHHWYQYQKLAQKVQLLVIPRDKITPDYYYDYQMKHDLNCIFLTETIPISASEIRQNQKGTGIKKVDQYIQQNGMYQ